MHVGLDQPAEASTQTIERVEKALATLQNIERCACDQHDHVSCAKAWMLMTWRVAHALDYDFRFVPPLVMAWLQRRLENGLGRTFSVLRMGTGNSPRALVVWAHEGSSDGICGASNVLVGRHAMHLRCAEQTAPGGTLGGDHCSGCKGRSAHSWSPLLMNTRQGTVQERCQQSVRDKPVGSGPASCGGPCARG